MHVAIVTKRLPPAICGIGDHTVSLAAALRAMGHEVTLFAGEGGEGAGRCIVPEFWHATRNAALLRTLAAMDFDHVVLQYTPLMFAIGGRWQNFPMAGWWSAWAQRWRTSLVLHETHFRAWWHPPSLLKGPLERSLMRRMVESARYVYTASQPLLEEVTGWRSGARVVRLPIGSNVPLAPGQRSRFRSDSGVADDDTVLVLFGGGEGLRRCRHYVDRVDAELGRRRVRARWLLLGGIRREWFSLSLPVIAPGIVPLAELSAWLQIGDVFLMPHVSGLCAKRGTLMAALQHGLPVVGTRGPMTDAFWHGVEGVKLTRGGAAGEFAEAVCALAKSPAERLKLGASNRDYFEASFTWDRIARTMVESWTADE